MFYYNNYRYILLYFQLDLILNHKIHAMHQHMDIHHYHHILLLHAKYIYMFDMFHKNDIENLYYYLFVLDLTMIVHLIYNQIV